jgi:hypothetical protein
MIKRKYPNRYSLKRIENLNAELPVRLKLIERCGGTPRFYDQTVYHNGTKHIIHRVYCVGGTCEMCGEPARFGEILEPHEDPKRSAGGKVSLEHSKMSHRRCHRKEHSKPQLEWIKE